MFDITILGGGPAGLVLAILLARQSYHVQLLERGDYLRPRPGETLGGELIDLLHSLELAEPLQQVAHLNFAQVRSCWGDDEPYERSSIFNPFGQGWHVDRAAWDAKLAELAVAAGVVVHLQSGTPRLCAVGDTWQISYRGGQSQTRYLVDASGRGAHASREVTQPRSWLQMDRLVAVFAPMVSQQIDDALVVEAGAHGWWYAAPQPDQSVLVCLMTDADLLPTQSAAQLSDYLLRSVQASQQIKASKLLLPARVARADSGVLWPYIGPNWCAIGDAAFGGDPLGGDGVVRGVRSAVEALPLIQQALSQGLSSSALTALNQTQLARFQTYLALRARHYGREPRFSQQIFWQRRQRMSATKPPMMLMPQQCLFFAATKDMAHQLAACEALLPYRALRALLYQLREPTPAHQAMALLQQHTPFEPSLLFAALQDLLMREVIRVV